MRSACFSDLEGTPEAFIESHNEFLWPVIFISKGCLTALLRHPRKVRGFFEKTFSENSLNFPLRILMF
jgi:hypothetical protein